MFDSLSRTIGAQRLARARRSVANGQQEAGDLRMIWLCSGGWVQGARRCREPSVGPLLFVFLALCALCRRPIIADVRRAGFMRAHTHGMPTHARERAAHTQTHACYIRNAVWLPHFRRGLRSLARLLCLRARVLQDLPGQSPNILEDMRACRTNPGISCVPDITTGGAAPSPRPSGRRRRRDCCRCMGPANWYSSSHCSPTPPEGQSGASAPMPSAIWLRRSEMRWSRGEHPGTLYHFQPRVSEPCG